MQLTELKMHPNSFEAVVHTIMNKHRIITGLCMPELILPSTLQLTVSF